MSVPVVIAGSIVKVPVITHESDFDPGIATKINAFFAKKICISYKETSRFFPRTVKKKIIFTGNPVRSEILHGNPVTGKKIMGCKKTEKVLLILGGSLGALAINKVIKEILDSLIKKCFVVHQMGHKNYHFVEKEHYYPVPFFHDEFPHILAAADLVVSRAGANTLWELAATGTPSILIPLSLSGSRGDQIRNAMVFKNLGIPVVLEENPLFREKLLETIYDLLDNDNKREEMRRRVRSFSVPDALDKLVEVVLDS